MSRLGQGVLGTGTLGEPSAPSSLSVAQGAEGEAKLSWTDNTLIEDGYYVYRATSSGSGTGDYTQVADIGGQNAYSLSANERADLNAPSTVETAINNGKYSVLFEIRADSEDGSTDWPDYIGSDADSWRIEDAQNGISRVALYVDDDSVSSGATQKLVGQMPHSSGEVHTGAFTIDATDTGGTVETYKNGSNVDTGTHPGKNNQTTVSLTEFLLSPARSLDFVIERLDFYDRVLSQSEVNDWHNGNEPTSGRIMSYSFNEGPNGEPTDSVSGLTANLNEGEYVTSLSDITYTDTGLNDGEKYFYRVSAYNTYGESYLSNEDSAITVLPQPSGVTATVDANDQITVSWTDEINYGDYHVQISRNDSTFSDPTGGPTTVGEGTTSATYDSTSDTAYDTHVGIDSKFEFRVRSETEHTSTSYVTTSAVYTDPIPPHDPSVTRPDASTIDISWSNQSTIEDGVEIQYWEDTGSGYGSWTTATTTASGATSASLTTSGVLSRDARYQVRLRTVAPDGDASRVVYSDYGNENNVFFTDDFEDQDLSEWDTVDTSNAGSGIQSGSQSDVGISGSEQGTYYLRLDDNDRVVKKLGDLSSESGVLVRLYAGAGSMDTPSEGTDIDWYDGSSWNQLTALKWEYNGEGWVQIVARVPDSWLSTDNRLRLDNEGDGPADYAVFDDVVVSDVLHEYTTPTAPSSLSMDSSVDNEMIASWTVNSPDFPGSYIRSRIKDQGGSYFDQQNDYSMPTSRTFTGLNNGTAYIAGITDIQEQPRHGSTSSFFSQSEQTVGGLHTTKTVTPSSTSLTDAQTELTVSGTVETSSTTTGASASSTTTMADGGVTASTTGTFGGDTDITAVALTELAQAIDKSATGDTSVTAGGDVTDASTSDKRASASTSQTDGGVTGASASDVKATADTSTTTVQSTSVSRAMPSPEPILDGGLDANWTFDEKHTDAEVATDIAGLYDGEFRQGVGTSAGQYGDAADFPSASSDDERIPIRGLTYTNSGEITELSVAAWVKISEAGFLVSFDRSEYYRLDMGGNFATTESNTGTDDMTWSSGLTDDTWHHVVFWYDADASGDNKRVYVDGTVVVSRASPHNGNGIGTGATRYGFIGNGSEALSFDGDYGPSDPPVGLIDDLRIYSRALNESEIDTLRSTDARYHEIDASATRSETTDASVVTGASASTTTVDPEPTQTDGSVTSATTASATIDPSTSQTDGGVTSATTTTSSTSASLTSGVQVESATATPLAPNTDVTFAFTPTAASVTPTTGDPYTEQMSANRGSATATALTSGSTTSTTDATQVESAVASPIDAVSSLTVVVTVEGATASSVMTDLSTSTTASATVEGATATDSTATADTSVTPGTTVESATASSIAFDPTTSTTANGGTQSSTTTSTTSDGTTSQTAGGVVSATFSPIGATADTLVTDQSTVEGATSSPILAGSNTVTTSDAIVDSATATGISPNLDLTASVVVAPATASSVASGSTTATSSEATVGTATASDVASNPDTGATDGSVSGATVTTATASGGITVFVGATDAITSTLRADPDTNTTAGTVGSASTTMVGGNSSTATDAGGVTSATATDLTATTDTSVTASATVESVTASPIEPDTEITVVGTVEQAFVDTRPSGSGTSAIAGNVTDASTSGFTVDPTTEQTDGSVTNTTTTTLDATVDITASVTPTGATVTTTQVDALSESTSETPATSATTIPQQVDPTTETAGTPTPTSASTVPLTPTTEIVTSGGITSATTTTAKIDPNTVTASDATVESATTEPISPSLNITAEPQVASATASDVASGPVTETTSKAVVETATAEPIGVDPATSQTDGSVTSTTTTTLFESTSITVSANRPQSSATTLAVDPITTTTDATATTTGTTTTTTVNPDTTQTDGSVTSATTTTFDATVDITVDVKPTSATATTRNATVSLTSNVVPTSATTTTLFESTSITVAAERPQASATIRSVDPGTNQNSEVTQTGVVTQPATSSAETTTIGSTVTQTSAATPIDATVDITVLTGPTASTGLSTTVGPFASTTDGSVTASATTTSASLGDTSATDGSVTQAQVLPNPATAYTTTEPAITATGGTASPETSGSYTTTAAGGTQSTQASGIRTAPNTVVTSDGSVTVSATRAAGVNTQVDLTAAAETTDASATPVGVTAYNTTTASGDVTPATTSQTDAQTGLTVISEVEDVGVTTAGVDPLTATTVDGSVIQSDTSVFGASVFTSTVAGDTILATATPLVPDLYGYAVGPSATASSTTVDPHTAAGVATGVPSDVRSHPLIVVDPFTTATPGLTVTQATSDALIGLKPFHGRTAQVEIGGTDTIDSPFRGRDGSDMKVGANDAVVMGDRNSNDAIVLNDPRTEET